MTKVRPIALVESMSGKICQDSDTYFTTRYGGTYSGRICHPNTKPASEAQLAVREAFKKAHQKVKDVVADKTSETYQAYAKEFAGQKKYKTLNGFLVAKFVKSAE